MPKERTDSSRPRARARESPGGVKAAQLGRAPQRSRRKRLDAHCKYGPAAARAEAAAAAARQNITELQQSAPADMEEEEAEGMTGAKTAKEGRRARETNRKNKRAREKAAAKRAARRAMDTHEALRTEDYQDQDRIPTTQQGTENQ